MSNKLRVLELFSGTGNVSKFFRDAGHETVTIDNNPDLKPDICTDILKLDAHELRKKLFDCGFDEIDVIWASPPCQSFSVMTISKNWTSEGKPKTAKSYLGLAIALKTVELIRELNPKYFFIENPRGMLRKQHFMRTLHRNTVTYCQYGATWMKPTDIWTNASEWIPKPKCNNYDTCHESSPSGYKEGIQADLSKDKTERVLLRGKIPDELCKEIVKVCEGRLEEKQEVLRS